MRQKCSPEHPAVDMYAFNKWNELYCGLFNDCLAVCFVLFLFSSACTMSSSRKFTFALSSADEFLVHQMFNASAMLLYDALKPAMPLTNGAINETLRHILDIPQGSVATHLGLVGFSVIVLLQTFSWFWQRNNLENRLIFGKVKAYKMVPIFGTPCSTGAVGVPWPAYDFL